MSFENKVREELRPLLTRMPKLDLKNNLAMIKSFAFPPREGSPLVLTENRMIAGPECELRIRIYQPRDRSASILPALYWIHGGGYILGSPDGDDPLCEQYVLDAQCVVASIDYRLAPEYTYPSAIEDCYAGLKWLHENAEELRVDHERIAIAGASAGGGLAAALALLARDRGGPSIAFQMPLYPMIDDRNITASSIEINGANMPNAWNREANIFAWNLFLGDTDSENVSQYAAAARAGNLTGLPPAYICVGELDPFRDETIDYVSRLAEAGVPVEFHLYPGCFHGFDGFVEIAEISRRARNEYVYALKRALNRE